MMLENGVDPPYFCLFISSRVLEWSRHSNCSLFFQDSTASSSLIQLRTKQLLAQVRVRRTLTQGRGSSNLLVTIDSVCVFSILPKGRVFLCLFCFEKSVVLVELSITSVQ